MAAQNSASDIADKLREAMKGWGTNEKLLIEAVANLTADNIQPVIDAYARNHSRDLYEDIKSETSGHFEDAVIALLTPVLSYEAQLARKAMKGLGTDEQILIDVICTRTPDEIKALEFEYNNIFARSIAEDIEGECSGDLKRLLLHRLRATEEKADLDADIELLYQAGQGKLGTDETVFINILSHRPKSYLAKLNTAYSNKHGRSIPSVIESEMRGDLKRALIATVTPAGEYFADRVYRAMKGIGTDDSTLIRILATQRFRNLKSMAAEYLTRHSVSLKSAVADELNGDYKKLFVALIEHIVEDKYVKP